MPDILLKQHTLCRKGQTSSSSTMSSTTSTTITISSSTSTLAVLGQLEFLKAKKNAKKKATPLAYVFLLKKRMLSSFHFFLCFCTVRVTVQVINLSFNLKELSECRKLRSENVANCREKKQKSCYWKAWICFFGEFLRILRW